MVRLSVWVTDEQKEWVESTANDRDGGQAEVIRELIDIAREPESELNQSDHPTDSLAETVTRLEAVADRLEVSSTESVSDSVSDSQLNQSDREDRTRSDAADGALSDSPSETMDTPRHSQNAAESGGPDTHALPDTDDADELARAFRRHLESRTPRKRHAKDAVALAFNLLRANGTMTTGDLRAALYEQAGDHYTSEKGMWESLRRYLEDIPGLSKAGYGEWSYEGDDAVREHLENL